jgi:UDP-2,4-diacetamido-2,4,6-trideoxy-beta-L-altropyranose hydrolase
MSSSRTKIFFRADGNSEIGLGHVIRSLALVDMISNQFDSSFFCINPSEYVKNEIKKYCKEINIIENESTFLNQIQRGQIVVLDGYQYTSEYMQQIVDKGAKLVYIDDMHNKFYPAHLIINHSPSAKAIKYNTADYTKLLLGLDYALLRRPFFKVAKKSKPNLGIKKLLITMGGADPLNFTQLILDAAEQSGLFEAISVVVGPEKKDQLSCSEKVTVSTRLNADEMAELMHSSDIMIGSASSVTIEAIASKLHVICGYYEENQKEFYDYLNDNKIVFGLGNFRNLQPTDFATLLKNGISFFKKNNSLKLIDGNQSNRFLTALNDLTYE